MHGSKDVSLDSSHTCHNCKKVFSSKSNCTRHLRQCHVEIEVTEVENEVENEVEDEVEDDKEMDEDEHENENENKKETSV